MYHVFPFSSANLYSKDGHWHFTYCGSQPILMGMTVYYKLVPWKVINNSNLNTADVQMSVMC